MSTDTVDESAAVGRALTHALTVACIGSAAAPPSSHILGLPADAPALLAAFDAAAVPLLALVQDMGTFLTHSDGTVRRRATGVLAAVLEHAPPAPAAVPPLLTFFCERLGDYPSVGPALRALSTLAGIAAAAPPTAVAVTISKAVFLEMNVQAMEQPLRQATYSLLLRLATTPAHAAALASAPALGDEPAALEFAVGFVQAVDGEKDPRCLMTTLAVARALLDPAPPVRLGDACGAYTRELFDTAACYFPITFTPPPRDPHGITRPGLLSALRSVFAVSPRLAPHVLPLLLEKLGSALPAARRDALQTLRAVAGVYGAAALGPHLPALAAALRTEVLRGGDAEGSAEGGGSDGGSGAAPPLLAASLWLGGPAAGASISPFAGDELRGSAAAAGGGAEGDDAAEDALLTAAAFTVGADFSGPESLHAHSGYGLYTPLTSWYAFHRSSSSGSTAATAAEAEAADAMDAATGSRAPLVEEALATVCEVARVLSVAAAGGGGGGFPSSSSSEWAAFAGPLVRAAAAEVARAAESPAARGLARVACACAAASPAAHAYVLQALLPAAARACDEAAAHARHGVRAAALGALAGLVHATDAAVDHAPGSHPLVPHLPALLAALMGALAPPPPPPGDGGGSPSVGASSAPPPLAATAARCIAAAGLCDLAVRPPSPLLTPAQKRALVAAFARMLTEDRDDVAREAGLRALAVMASARARLCAAVLEIAVPPLVAVLEARASGNGGGGGGDSVRSGISGEQLASPIVEGRARTLAAPAAACGHDHDHDDPSACSGGGPQPPDAQHASARHAAWYRDVYALGLGARPARALYALGQLCCIADAAAARAIVPQLLRVAFERRRRGGGSGGGPAEAALLARRVVQPRGGAGGLCAAVVEMLARIALSKAAAGAGQAGALDDMLLLEAPAAAAVEAVEAAAEAGSSLSVAAVSPRADGGSLAPLSHLRHVDEDDDRAEGEEEHAALVPTLYLALVSVVEPDTAPPAGDGGGISTFSSSSPFDAGALARIVAAAEPIFRAVGLHASAPAQDALRDALLRVLLPPPPPPKGGAPPPEVTAAGLLAQAPWFRPLAADAPAQQFALLPVLLKPLLCTRARAPTPRLPALVSALLAAAFAVPCGSLPSVEDPLQRFPARARLLGLARPQQPQASGVAAASAAAECAPASLELSLQRAAVMCAQLIGVQMNRCPLATDAERLEFSGALQLVLSTAQAALAAGVSGAAGSDEESSDDRGAAQRVSPAQRQQERAVLVLVWLCKGLAMRGHPAAVQVAAALVELLLAAGRGGGAGRAHVAALAGQGLGCVIAEAPPQHPFGRAAGTACQGLYKQRLFAFVHNRHKAAAAAAEADAAVLPLLMALCAMAPHLPVAALLSEADSIASVTTRALAAVLAAAAPSAGASAALSGATAAAAAAEHVAEMRDAVAAAALACMRVLCASAPAAVAKHVPALVPALLALAAFRAPVSPGPGAAGAPSGSAKPAVRGTAVECLRLLLVLPYAQLHPLRQAVVAGLQPVLDDPKRAVRRRAAATRSEWITLVGQ